LVVLLLCLLLCVLYRYCPDVTKGFKQIFSSEPKRKRLALQDIHVMHATGTGAVIRSMESVKEPQYEQPYPVETQFKQNDYYEMPTADPYADIGPVPESIYRGPVPESIYESVYESISDPDQYRQSSNTYSQDQMSHISLDSRPNPSKDRYDPSVQDSRYNPSVQDSRYNPSVQDSRYNPSVQDSRYNPSVAGSRYDPSVAGSRYDPVSSMAGKYDPMDVDSRYSVADKYSRSYNPSVASSKGYKDSVEGRYKDSIEGSRYGGSVDMGVV